MAMIEFQDVHKWYGDFHVLNGISEKVEKGEVLVIWAVRIGKKYVHQMSESSRTHTARRYPY